MENFPKHFDHSRDEQEIYKKWEKSGYFNPDNLKLSKNAKPFTIILPPPNITDKLHIGHSAMLAIEDLAVRYHRMKGYRTLWVPGTDHAAIATQNAVEKKLLKENKMTRHQLGKDRFLKEVWRFLDSTQRTILSQIRKMGSSLDWSREAFTLDEKRKQAVKKMFVDMYNERLIYRGERIVNWCPRCHSTLADDEMEYESQKGMIFTFRYDKDFPIAIATTRPETKLGDTAVAVNPKDKRYAKYIGKTIEADFCGQSLKLKIIGSHEVDMDFGTGALGVTPAHSMIDWKMADANDLEKITVIDEQGKIREGFGVFSGKDALMARKMIVEELKKSNLLLSEDEIENNLSVCYRCGTAVEPLPSEQWFVDVDKKIRRLDNKSLKEKSIEAAKSGKIKFIPERFEKRYLDWMENLHDWCISRQIWFGHQIPVWYRNGEIYCSMDDPKGKGWKQDPDTLDTWFSSGMWTFSTLGWPETYRNGKKTGDLARYHPTQVLETGHDILTLWVSRMILMSFFALDEIPFEKVYLHGLVLDKNGKKMSKSLGNGIDPLDMIVQYGADATRLALLIGSTPGNDVKFYTEKIEGFRNLVTKIWNICRYSAQNYPEFRLEEKIAKKNISSFADRWIVSRLNNVIVEITRNLDDYKFSLAGEKLKDFTWNELADWYLEINKQNGNRKVLGYVLDKLIKLWHPFIPYVTESIYHELGNKKDYLMVEDWPRADKKLIDNQTEKRFAVWQELVAKVRNLRSLYHIDPKELIMIYGRNIEEQAAFEKLTRCSLRNETRPKKKLIDLSANKTKIYVDIFEKINVKKELDIATKEKIRWDKLYQNCRIKLDNASFVANAPTEIINETKSKLLEYREKVKQQDELIISLNDLSDSR
jgi:valyl-tRNA synthetase